MARLVSYKAKDENRYSTFGNEVSCNSNENLTERNSFKLVPKRRVSPLPSTIPVVVAPIAPRPLVATNTTKELNCSRLALCSKCCHHRWKYCPTIYDCCWYVCCWGCCNRWKRSSYGCDDDDDIDAKFEQYKYEMRLREANGGANASGDGQATAKARNSLGRGKKYWNWNWNDSMRSNSDKFLETLEHDLEVDRGCRRSGYCNPVIRITQGRYWFSFLFFSFVYF